MNCTFLHHYLVATLKMRRATSIVLLLCGLVGIASKASAAVVLGGSTLLGSGDADQLQTWLGEGPIALERIFEHVAGDDKYSWDFHIAADGQGRTFSVIEVFVGVDRVRQVIGGYNPQSWSSSGVYNTTPENSRRTAEVAQVSRTREHLKWSG